MIDDETAAGVRSAGWEPSHTGSPSRQSQKENRMKTADGKYVTDPYTHPPGPKIGRQERGNCPNGSIQVIDAPTIDARYICDHASDTLCPDSLCPHVYAHPGDCTSKFITPGPCREATCRGIGGVLAYASVRCIPLEAK